MRHRSASADGSTALVFFPSWEGTIASNLVEFLKDFGRVTWYRRLHKSTSRVPIFYDFESSQDEEFVINFSGPLPDKLHINGVETWLTRGTARQRMCLARRASITPGENVISTNTPWIQGRVRLGTILARGTRGEMRALLEEANRGESSPPLDPQVGGTLELLSLKGGELRCLKKLPLARNRPTVERDLDSPVDAALGFLERSQIRDGQFAGSFYGAWDSSREAYRLPSWVWTSGVVVEALLSHGRTGWLNEFTDLLRKIPFDGVGSGRSMVVRWDLMRDSPSGITPWLSPNDMAHFAAHGLLGDGIASFYPQASELAIEFGDWILANAIDTDGQLAKGYRLDLGVWERSWLYVDAAYTTELFVELYELTGNQKYLDASRSFLEWFVQRFVAGNGIVAKGWSISGSSDAGYLRGYAWALAGLVAHCSCDSANPRLREALTVVVASILANQEENGSWLYTQGQSSSGECPKTTAAMAYYLLKAEEVKPLIGDELWQGCQIAATRAIRWLTEKMNLDSRSPGSGGISAWTEEGAIVGCRRADVAMVYSSAFFILASKKSSALKLGE